VVECGRLGAKVSFDRATGGVVALELNSTQAGDTGADETTPIPVWRGSMGGFVYQTASVADYAAYGKLYGPNFTACDVPAVPADQNTCQLRVKYCKGSSFVKVNMSHALPEHREVSAVLPISPLPCFALA
jgi:hypothetical protein